MSSVKDEAFIRAGLAKSAFRESIYEGLPWQYYMDYIVSVQRMLRNMVRVLPRVYQAHDAFLMFYKPYDAVWRSLKQQNKAAPIWHRIISEAIRKENFYEVNQFTRGSTDLSILAAYQFLRNILNRGWSRKLEQIQQQLYEQLKSVNGPKAISKAINDALAGFNAAAVLAIKEESKQALQEALTAVREYSEAKSEAEAAIESIVGSGGSGFNKEALSVLHFLEHPDSFRQHVNILRWARVFTTHFMTVLPTSFSHEQIVSSVGGISGVGRMIDASKISDILPSELALMNLGEVGRALFAVKYASRQLMAYQHATAIKPVVFVDKSGSMAGTIKAGKYVVEGGVPKISIAAGVALAMYKKYNADVYLFDTEVTAVKPSDIVNTLLTISADGGTNIDSVIEEINHINKMDYIYIIISDGITEASGQHLAMLRRFAPRVKLILVDYAREPSYNWVQLLKQFNNVMLVNDVASFESAVKRALSTA